MRKYLALLAALFAVTLAQPDSALAQGKGKGKEKQAAKQVGTSAKVVKSDRDDDAVRRTNARRDDDVIRVGTSGRRTNDDIYRGTYSTGSGKGPAFCRSGAGHPVHGRQWCVNKGFGLGNSRWDRGNWDGVIFRQEPRSNIDIGRSVLGDILGNVIFNRLDARRQYLGVSQPLTGRWVNADGGSVLLVSAGRTPIAELVDRNRDRRVDLVLLNFR